MYPAYSSPILGRGDSTAATSWAATIRTMTGASIDLGRADGYRQAAAAHATNTATRIARDTTRNWVT